MKSFAKLFIVGGIIILSIFYFFSYYSIYPEKEIEQICFYSGKCFNTIVADSSKERAEGLMFKDSLEENSGMLFIFLEQEKYDFWMKNTFIELDIIWLDSTLKIVHIKENAEPCLEEECEIFSSNKNAKYVLEINGGLAKKFGLKIGEKAKFNEIHQ